MPHVGTFRRFESESVANLPLSRHSVYLRARRGAECAFGSPSVCAPLMFFVIRRTMLAQPLHIVEPKSSTLAIHLGKRPSPIARLEENPWESVFFGRMQGMASIDFEALPGGDARVLGQVVASLGSAADRLGYALTELRIDARNTVALCLLEDAGFRVVESRVGFKRLVEKASVRDHVCPSGLVRWRCDSDREALLELTRDGFVRNDAFQSRFKNPRYFSPEQTERYYSAWVTHHLDANRYHWAVLDVAGRVVGYHLYSRIGVRACGTSRYRGMLSSVAAGSRGANTLAALRSFAFKNVPEDRYYWETFSQLSNFPTITSVMHHGMRLASVEHILYRERPTRCAAVAFADRAVSYPLPDQPIR
jgi:hypothetical protein